MVLVAVIVVTFAVAVVVAVVVAPQNTDPEPQNADFPGNPESHTLEEHLNRAWGNSFS